MRLANRDDIVRPQAPPGEALLPLRFSPSRWAGALGDAGTLAPIYLGLVAYNGLPPARSLALVGAVYVAAAMGVLGAATGNLAYSLAPGLAAEARLHAGEVRST